MKRLRAVSDTSQMVSMPSGRKALLVSSTPLTVDVDGKDVPLDLSLTERDGAFEPRASGAPFEVDPQVADGVSFPDTDVTMGVASPSKAAPVVTAGTAFWGNVARDADYQLIPTPKGIESFFTLRSIDSPSSYRLQFDLPAGASLKKAVSAHPIPGDPPRSIEIAGPDGQPLGYVNPVSAIDARGSSVNAEMRIDGDSIVIGVEHRGKDVQYPIQVDPPVSVYTADSPGPPNSIEFWGWGWGQYRANAYAGQGLQDSYFGQAWGDCAYYCGLYQSIPTNSFFTAGDFAQYTWTAPAGTYLLQTVFGNWGHQPFYSTAGNGIYNNSTGWNNGMSYVNAGGGTGGNPWAVPNAGVTNATHTYCRSAGGTAYNPTCASSIPPDGETAVMSLQVTNSNPNYVFTTNNRATSTMQYTYFFLGDRYAPSFTGSTPPDTGWTNDQGAVHSVPAGATSVHDDGLGISSVTLSGTASDSYTISAGCTGDPARSPCPHDWAPAGLGYRLSEGTSKPTLKATDAFGNMSAERQWTEKIDRTRPKVTSFSGDLWNNRSGVYTSRQTLTVSAEDPAAPGANASSGIRKIGVGVYDANGNYKFGIDDPEPRTSPCDGCSKTSTFDIDLGSLPDGTYTVKAFPFDFAGNYTDPSRQSPPSDKFDLTLDLAGDVYHATVYDASVDAASVTADEWAQLGTTNARVDNGAAIETIDREPCSNSSSGCLTLRSRTVTPGADDLTATDAYSLVSAQGATDDRLTDHSSLLGPANQSLGAPSASGRSADIQLAGQRMPPADEGTYVRYDTSEAIVVNDEEVTQVRKLWLATSTRLPLREETFVNNQLRSRTIYSYTASRDSTAALSPDFFKIARPSSPSSDESQQLAPDDPAPAGDNYSRSEALAHDAVVRARFGFSTDPSHLAALRDDATPNAGYSLLGFPADAVELAEIRLRTQIAAAAQGVRDWINGQPTAASEFAGLYIEPTTGALVANFVGNTSTYINQILNAALVPGQRLSGHTVAYSLDALQQAEDRISADSASDGKILGQTVIAWGYDERTDRVVLTIANAVTPSYQASVASTYGPAVVVEQDSAGGQQLRTGTETQGINPARGGISIFSKHSGCTAAMPGRYTVTRSGITRRVRTILTNAHCTETDTTRDGTFNTRDHDGKTRFLGRATAFAFSSDAAILTLNNRATTNGYVYVGSRFVHTFPLKSHYLRVSRVTPRRPEVGSTVCVAEGASDSLECGDVLAYEHHQADPSHYYFQGTRASVAGKSLSIDADAKPGDSGSPIFSPYDDNGVTKFQHIGMLWGGDPTGIHLASQCCQRIYGINVDRLINGLPGGWYPEIEP